MVRLGLCCQFVDQPIKFRTTTVTYLRKQTDPYCIINSIVLHNFKALLHALYFCSDNGIGCFRITSRMMPLVTHPEFSYHIDDLKDAEKIYQTASECNNFAADNDIRLTTHPDQFVVLNSPHKHVVDSSIAELKYHAILADMLGIDVINIHAGGVYGEKNIALQRLESVVGNLPDNIKTHLTIENDDRSYTPQDLYPLCKRLDIPLVYDVHHHRCLSDRWSEREATEAALDTWHREPLFHISSPKEGWHSSNLKPHSDYIDFNDYPVFWREIIPLTVEIEAKAKERAVLLLRDTLS